MESNPQIELAERYLMETDASIFLTGKAGTGKTTFLKHITKVISKRYAIVAPTGVAAINAGGVTIHSLFQLPFGPFLPDVPELVTEYQDSKHFLSIRKNKADVIKQLQLLIIDEVSMVRADLLDAISYRLQVTRHSSRPFGGVQLLLIGDLHQLSPVVTDAEAPYLYKVYPSPYFFNSKALQQTHYETITLKHVYRQQDEKFVQLLNNIRDNRFDAQTLETLNQRYQPDFEKDKKTKKNTIHLTTHNNQADAYNNEQLKKLRGKTTVSEAIVVDNFPTSLYPTDESIELKVGAQVMFIKNDRSQEKRYYNGKIGTITNLDEETDDEGNVITTAYVSDSDGGDDIAVDFETWENFHYVVDEKTKEIKKVTDGTFHQLPLRLAWAITIHKSQGLTFDNVVIDASKAFAYGQVYVALSRCRTFEGLVLSTPLTASCSVADYSVQQYDLSRPTEEATRASLQWHKQMMFFDKLRFLFDLEELKIKAEKASTTLNELLPQRYEQQKSRCSQIYDRLLALNETSSRFNAQINSSIPTFQLDFSLPASKIEGIHYATDANGRAMLRNQEEYFAWLNSRINNAIGYYMAQLQELNRMLSPLVDMKVTKKSASAEVKEKVQDLFYALRLKMECLNGIGKQCKPLAAAFSPEKYNALRMHHTEQIEKERRGKKE